MSQAGGDYWSRPRHPWSCVLFVVPLLAIYEVGLHFLGPLPVATLRNGADVWLRSGLAAAGIAPAYGSPVLLVLILLAWTLFYREPRPDDPISVWIGMTVESVVLAGVLYGASQALWPFLDSVSGALEGRNATVPALSFASEGRVPDPRVASLVRYLGAGIYEETLFRLLLLSALLAAFNLGELPRRWGLALAALASALLFAGAHNLGPNGETFQGSLFLFRTLAGLFFAWVYCVRGFGIAVGAHAGYDALCMLIALPASS
jgi:membrane protease YdiL (CAAX protease family)